MRVNIEGLINRLDDLRERLNKLFDKLEKLDDLEQEEMAIEDVEQHFQNDDAFNLSIALSVLEQADKLDKALEKFGIDDSETLEEILKVHKHLLDHDYSTLPKEDFDLLFEKVEQYKEIEKELGIELITLYKCFKSTKFYVKNLFNEIIEVKSDIVRFDIGNGYVYFGADYCPLSSYGKTWALTRKELEK